MGPSEVTRSSLPGLAHFYSGSALMRKQLRVEVGEDRPSPPEAKYLVMQDFGGGWREWGRGEGTPHTFLQRLEQGGAG